jgi:hypothetical protein
MAIKTERMTGFILLGVGLLLIFIAVNCVYTIFSGAATPPELFKIDSITISVPTGTDTSTKPMELLKGEQASKFINMAVWYILMLFILSAGSKIAGLGVQLLREIKVVVKGNNTSSTISTEG